MNSIQEKWKKIEEAVIEASQMSGEERERWLAEFCGGDAELRAEIDSLLAFEDEAESFLERSADSYAAKILPDGEEPQIAGKQFGHYRIIREIGRGGMGAVFLAERTDGEFEQQAALKIVRQTIFDPESERRFRRERQILASLNHPNIARLLDGGVSENGEPFLVMEYIEGEPLAEFAENHNLALEEKLKLFLKICSAVSYAHRNLVVHRDIKPSNILVTEEGEPKLLDFGLAKILDESLSDKDQTATVFRALTPAYASPEQKRGAPVTTASDVYSLGIVLYELVKNNRFERREPGYLTHKPKTELDAILLTALDEEPERRYKSVEQFADDLERYLRGQTVGARPNTFSYRAAKFVRRNKLGVSAALLILLVLIGGVAATIWQARRAEQQRVRAEKRFGEVRQLANSLMFEIHDSVQNLQGSTPTRQLIVNKALNYLDSLAQESGDADAGLKIELATAYEKIGDIQGNPYSANLGDTAGALASYQKAASIYEQLPENQLTTEAEIGYGRIYRALGDIAEVKGNTAECINHYRRSLEIFAWLADKNPQNFAAQDELARAYETLGDGLSRTPDAAAERLDSYRKTLAIRQSLTAQNTSDRKTRRGVAIAFTKIGEASGDNYAEAENNLRKAIEILEDLSRNDPTNARARREIGYAYFQLGIVLTNVRNFPAALEARQKAFAIRREFAANDSQNKQAQFDLATAYADLSEAFTNTGDTNQGLENAREALKLMSALAESDPENNIYRRNVGLCHEKFAIAFARKAADEKLSATERINNWDEAVSSYQKTLQTFVELRDRNALQPRDAGQIDKFTQQIQMCEAERAKLSGS
ncbi:MAG TPA: protein kinase [Pyrinomonadaceae bacterium]|jgi:tetratricopeptide (TPR) repeat protein/tRNA A-37 threonylcarbamoyl transferase component Bud32